MTGSTASSGEWPQTIPSESIESRDVGCMVITRMSKPSEPMRTRVALYPGLHVGVTCPETWLGEM